MKNYVLFASISALDFGFTIHLTHASATYDLFMCAVPRFREISGNRGGLVMHLDTLSIYLQRYEPLVAMQKSRYLTGSRWRQLQ